MRLLRSRPGARRWTVWVPLALAPIWLIGTLDRGYWTPDEPRVADIAWRMSQQHHWALPELAGTPFLEKPPLTFWMAAGSLRLFGRSAAAMRVPNLLYATITALAVGTLGLAMDGTLAAVVAALVAGTALTALRVEMWLATDACLLAGCAVALLGAWLGYCAPRGRRKLLGYTLMHAGAAIGFMTKSAPGWLVPALALLTLIGWERRWSELRRWELYAGLILQALVIGPWLYAVLQTAHGSHALLVMFWYNLAGRFMHIAAPRAYDYSAGHRNSPLKYFLELPVYLLPWTALAGAALWRARDRARLAGPAGSRWRFALAASLPFLILLSLAATARDIYAAPALLGFSLLIGLWASDAQRLLSAADRGALRWTRRLVALIAALFALALAVLALGAATSRPGAPWAVALEVAPYALAALATLAAATVGLRRAAQAQRRGDVLRSFAWTCAAYITAFCVSALAVFPTVDRWQDLPALARRIRVESEHRDLALLDPDETTIAMLDLGLRTRFVSLQTHAASARHVVGGWFARHGARARVLVLLPGHARGELTPLLEGVHVMDRGGPGDGVAGDLQAEGIARIARRYSLPQGRRYALLAPPAGPMTVRRGAR
jgi:4-amino-4-deoxy-L-arabinose transferase-like glycosyltransferase